MGDFADSCRRTWSVTRRRRGAGRAAARRCGLGVAEAARSGEPRWSTTSGGSRCGRIWQKPGPLTAGEWEQVRLHPYHSERVLLALAVPRRARAGRRRASRAAGRLRLPPGRGRRRALAGGAAAGRRRRLPRDDRTAAPSPAARPGGAAETLGGGSAGRLDPDAVGAVLEAAGQPVATGRAAGRADRTRGRGRRPAGARAADQADRPRARISVKTADRHMQNAYAKIGVSTRAAAPCSRCSTGSWPGENSRWSATRVARNVDPSEKTAGSP